ncbi:acyl-CoA dehydrogenase family protein [Brevundimonas variabilis]|uniref:Alkylation response protein AidB-like acyl-CoA dehydrogenase n=1 Tax=Brevundimonas variabilis TaxID=74312 RepID=A0A7W9CL83_9CAUL|nr:acyl-CoA dehydrogenase family protein [Brevundimonas variabilis]MBB5747601.1 alkylation response protein AidB-like acyl-CoA dehydrogenase [Brevundimonas variabilis]
MIAQTAHDDTGATSVRETVLALHDRLASLGERYDAVPRFPADSLALIARSSLHRRYAPVASGGQAFASVAQENLDMLDALRGVGRADLSLGRLFEGHVNALKLFDWYGTPGQQRVLGEQLDQGLFYGVWATEPAPGVTIEQEGPAEHLQGQKAFATGAGGLGFAVVTARPQHGPRRLVVIPANHADRTDLSDWRVRGMRATGSGRYDVSGISVTMANTLGEPGDYDREPRFTAGAWRFTAVQLGGIEGLLAETRSALSDAARADPLQRAKFAEAVVAARTAGLWVREAALRAASEDPDASAFARLTRGVVERAGLDVMELSARLIGTRSAFDGQRIDKITRDLSLYLRQAGPDYARDQAAIVWLDHDAWGEGDALW